MTSGGDEKTAGICIALHSVAGQRFLALALKDDVEM